MTTFQYCENEQLNKLAMQIFGEGKATADYERRDMVNGYKYILAYCIVYGKKIDNEVFKAVKQASIRFDDGLRNLVFFDKAEYGKDFIYFDEYMRQMENSKGFLKTWSALQEASAA